MMEDNVISIQDDLNLALTVQQIRDFEKILLEAKDFKETWLYMLVDGNSGRYVYEGPEGRQLRHPGAHFIPDLCNEAISLYDLEHAQKLCDELNQSLKEEPNNNVLFAPIAWRRYSIIHLAGLYDLIQKMDAKGKTKRFFASC